MLLEWSEHLSIDHAEIDQEHRYMMRLIDRLYNTPNNGVCLDEMENLFGDFVYFMAVHFQHEEQLMTEVEYPKLATHAKEHDCLIATYASYFYDRGARDRIARQRALTELSMLIIEHIKAFDRPLAFFCKANQSIAECA